MIFVAFIMIHPLNICFAILIISTRSGNGCQALLDTLGCRFGCLHQISIFILVLLALTKIENIVVPISIIVPPNKMVNTTVIIYNLSGVNATSAFLLISPASSCICFLVKVNLQ